MATCGGPRPSARPPWDPDGAGAQNFSLINSATLFGRFGAFGSNSILFSSGGQLQNIATGRQVGSGQTPWRNGNFWFTYNGGNGAGGYLQNFSSTPGQFGFRFTEGTDTYYGWGSLVIDALSAGRGYKITEAYYQSTPGTAINVGQVPVAVPEPTSMALLAIGSAGVLAWRARRKQSA